jgi:hypothetical protein
MATFIVSTDKDFFESWKFTWNKNEAYVNIRAIQYNNTTKNKRLPIVGNLRVFIYDLKEELRPNYCIVLLVYLHKLGQPKINLLSQRRFAGNLCPISLAVQSTSE